MQPAARPRTSLVMLCMIFVHPVGEAQAASPDRMVVVVSARCEAMVPAYCRGGFGFRVAPDGAFLAGPDPAGRSLAGHLRRAEGRALRSAAGAALADASAAPADCHDRPAIPGAGETVTVSDEHHAVVLHGAGGRLDRACASGREAAKVLLFRLADRLMRRYYPVPF